MALIVCLFGPDGVGKSTQVEKLNDFLSSKGFKVKTVWIRGPHTLSFLISRILIQTGRVKETVNPYGRIKRTPWIRTSTTMKQAWTFIEFISVLPLILIKVLLPHRMGYTIIADRYVLDTIVTIAYHIDDPNFIHGRIARMLIGLVPRDSLLFHLDADYDTLIKRRERLVEPREFIEFQKLCYRRLGELTSAYYIDTSCESIHETSLKIIDVVLAQQERNLIG